MGKLLRIGNKFVKNTLQCIDSFLESDWSIRWHSYRIGFHVAHYSFDETQIAIIHIPKTGGTTLYNVLEQVSPAMFVNLHMHRPVSLDCPPQQFRYITFLRHPIERVWSYYRMARQVDKNNPYHKYAFEGLEHFIKHCWEVRNMTCKYLSSHPYKNMNEEFCMLAKYNLRSFFFVGLFENFEEDMRNLLDKLGVAHDSIAISHLLPSVNEKLSEEDKEIIKKYNQYDIDIFNSFVEEHKSQTHA